MEISFFMPPSIVEWPDFFEKQGLPIQREEALGWRARYTFLSNDQSGLILDVDVHEHGETNLVHWVLKVSTQPDSEPPDYVRVESDTVGGAMNFLSRAAEAWGRLDGPIEIIADATYAIDAEVWERRVAGIELPVARSPRVAGFPDNIIVDPVTSVWTVTNHSSIRRLMIVTPSGKRSFAVTAQARYTHPLQVTVLNRIGDHVWQDLQAMLDRRT